MIKRYFVRLLVKLVKLALDNMDGVTYINGDVKIHGDLTTSGDIYYLVPFNKEEL